jgi:hypothetical protein
VAAVAILTTRTHTVIITVKGIITTIETITGTITIITIMAVEEASSNSSNSMWKEAKYSLRWLWKWSSRPNPGLTTCVSLKEETPSLISSWQVGYSDV